MKRCWGVMKDGESSGVVGVREEEVEGGCLRNVVIWAVSSSWPAMAQRTRHSSCSAQACTASFYLLFIAFRVKHSKFRSFCLLLLIVEQS